MLGKKHTEEWKKQQSIRMFGHKGYNTKANAGSFKKGSIPWNKGKKIWMTKQHPRGMLNKISSRKGKKCPELSGINHWRWIKDRSKLKIDRQKMYDVQYKYWMLEVKKRDSWKCRINNSDCGGRLESHHILNWKDYPELRYEINNGITLCHAHHPKGRKKEAELSSYFQKLVAEMQ